MSGCVGDMGDPLEDKRLSDYHVQEKEYRDQQYRKQEDSEQEEDSSAGDDSDSESLPDLRAENSSPGMKAQWWNKVDISKFSAGGPGQDAMRRQTQRQVEHSGLAR